MSQKRGFFFPSFLATSPTGLIFYDQHSVATGYSDFISQNARHQTDLFRMTPETDTRRGKGKKKGYFSISNAWMQVARAGSPLRILKNSANPFFSFHLPSLPPSISLTHSFLQIYSFPNKNRQCRKWIIDHFVLMVFLSDVPVSAGQWKLQQRQQTLKISKDKQSSRQQFWEMLQRNAGDRKNWLGQLYSTVQRTQRNYAFVFALRHACESIFDRRFRTSSSPLSVVPWIRVMWRLRN